MIFLYLNSICSRHIVVCHNRRMKITNTHAYSYKNKSICQVQKQCHRLFAIHQRPKHTVGECARNRCKKKNHSLRNCLASNKPHLATYFTENHDFWFQPICSEQTIEFQSKIEQSKSPDGFFICLASVLLICRFSTKLEKKTTSKSKWNQAHKFPFSFFLNWNDG